MRAPYNLHQTDSLACLSCVTANILFMFDTSSRPDVASVDHYTGRKSGTAADYSQCSVFLLRRGFSLLTVNAFNPKRILSGGFSYLQEYYGKQWDAKWAACCTPELLAEFQAQALRAQERLEVFGKRARIEYRVPSLDDARALLDRGRVIRVSTETSQPLPHAVLVYARNGNNFSVYYPKRQGDCLQTWSANTLTKVWRTTEGLTAYWC